MREHRKTSIGAMRPLFDGPIPIEFHSVVVRVPQIECFAYSMIRRAFERDSRLLQSAQGICQCGALGVKDSQMIKSGGSRRWRRTAPAFPRVKADVMVITTRRNERRLTPVALCQRETEHPAIEARARSRSATLRCTCPMQTFGSI